MAIAEEEAIFNAARHLASSEARRQYVEDTCRGNPQLKARIESLLRIHESDRTFLQTLAHDVQVNRGDSFGSRLGSVIGPYRLIESIGEGGMGTVYRAEQTQPVRREVALKIIQPGMNSRQVLGRFEAERQALALMDHPNISRVFDAGQTEEGRPFFVMELVHGIAITQYCDEHRLSPRERLELFIPVCQAVQHAHQKGIIHRDLKPSNVLVAIYDDRPVPKIIDFGLAKAMAGPLTERTLDTAIGTIVGTFQYMSPEQASTDQKDIDTRSDIYSLGVILYELLTGSTPFAPARLRDAAWIEMVRIIREEEPPRPSTRIGTTDELPSIAANRGLEPKKLSGIVRGDLDWIVMKSLEKDRARRYETANGLARDIQRFLNEEPVEACPPSAGYRFRKFARRHMSALAFGLSMALLILAGAAISAWLAVRATRAERRASIERDLALAEKDRADQQAAIAKAVSGFLQEDLLEQADIGNQPTGPDRNRHITVRELLDRSAQVIDAKFRDQPRTEAAIRHSIGAAYHALGEYSEAEKHLLRAVELSAAAWGTHGAQTLECTRSLATAYFAQGNFVEAEKLYKQILAVVRTELGDDHLATLSIMSDLGLLYVSLGRYRDAEELLEPAIRGRTAKLGAGDLKTLESKNGLAVLNFALRRYDRAGALFQELRDGFQVILGPDHPHTLASAGNLGASYLCLQQHGKAELILKDVLAIKRAKLGDDHPETLSTMQNLAQVYQEVERFEEAEEMYRKTLEGRKVKQGTDHRDTLRTMQNFATYFVDRGQFEPAEKLYQEALAIQRIKLGNQHPETIVVLHNLGTLYRRQARYEESETMLREALTAARKTLTLEHGDTQSVIYNLAMVTYLCGTPERAEAELRELLTYFENRPQNESASYANGLANLTFNLLAQKKFAEAEPLARRCVELRAKMPETWSTFLAKSQLGGALAGQKRFDQAEPLLVQGYEGMKRREATIPILSRIHLSKAHERLIQLYEDWGRSEDAAKWRKQQSAGSP